MRPRRRDQGRQPLEQLPPLHHDMRRPVSPGRLEPIGESTIGHRLEATQGQRGTRDITTESLESLSIACRDRDVGMQAHAALTNAARGDHGPGLDSRLVLLPRLHPIPEPSPRLARLGSRRDPGADRGRAERRHQRIIRSEGIVIPIAAASLEDTQDAASRSRQHARHVLGLRGRQRRELSWGIRPPGVDAIEHERMEVGGQVQGGPEALDERDRAALTLADAEERSCATPLIRVDGAHEGAKDLTRESCVPGAAIAERIGQREDPLSDGNLGQDPVDEVGRSVGHTPAAAGGTEAAAFAAEGDEPVLPARVAVDAQESVGQDSALEIRADLALDEAGDGSTLRSGMGEEGDELRADDFVEKGLLGLVAGVVGDGEASIGTGSAIRGERSGSCPGGASGDS